MKLNPFSRKPQPAMVVPAASGAKCVLNVGGNSKEIPIPGHYDGWTHLLLDIDPKGNPDVLCDARELKTRQPTEFDAVYCSHNLEHYYRHDVGKVLRGFRHVLKDDGFAEIRVPDLRSVMQRCVADDLGADDVLYESPAGPITVCDVLYGLAWQIEKSGVDFYAHKTGFTAAALTSVLEQAGFEKIFVSERTYAYEISALAFKRAPTPWQCKLFGL
ncbi:MAG: methyltransferase domain-containing protein [Casimicrobiaceae bacterium]